MIDLEEQKAGHFAQGLNFYKMFLVCFIGSFAGVVIEMLWCLISNGYIESRAYFITFLNESALLSQVMRVFGEDARFVLPNACSTKMIVTMNARSLNNFFRHRCCQRAQWEIRELADEMLRLVNEVAPALFARSGPPCVSGACPEGSMSCGRAAEMRKKYAFLKGDEMV